MCIILIFLGLTVIPDELEKNGIDIHEEFKAIGLDFIGEDGKYEN